MSDAEPELEVAPDVEPEPDDILPNEFEPVATLVVNGHCSASARAKLVTHLRQEFDVELEHADEHSRAFAVLVDRRDSGGPWQPTAD